MTAPEVRVGQVWADNDVRSEGRTLRVVSIVGDKARCEVVTNSHGVQRRLDNPALDWYQPRDRRGQNTSIALRRFKPTKTGYRLVKDVDGGEQS